MRYYKTGEFAKMANVSIRTIRWYDKQGLLKPTMIAENGYRLYTDKDFVKLQQILSLKQLGFSLEEIFSMTLNDDVNSLMQSLELQSTLIEGKINHLLAIQSAIEETKNVLSDKQDIDWNQLIKLIKMTSMNDSVVEQYRDSSNLEIRIRLHERYSVNQETWFSWLFRQYHLENGMKVLEVGCGNGELWKKNAAAIPDASITLSDISEGMVNDAKENLEHVANMRYACFDVEDIPYDDATFDVVIANHVLFYIKDLPAALNEIYRVLKPEGVFYASSYGQKHMHEITDLVKEFDTRITLSNINPGNYLIDVTVVGSGKWTNATQPVSFTVDKHQTSISALDATLSIVYGGIYTATFASELAGQNATLTVEAKEMLAKQGKN